MGQSEVDTDRSSQVRAMTNLGLLVAGLTATNKFAFIRIGQTRNIFQKHMIEVKATQTSGTVSANVNVSFTVDDLASIPDINVVIDALWDQSAREIAKLRKAK